MGKADSRRNVVRDLIGRRPHPVKDQEALGSLQGDPGGSRVRLANELANNDPWRAMTLGALLPGLESVEEPSLLECLSVRSSNALDRGGIESWTAVAATSPERLSMEPGFGAKSLQEVLQEALRYWAAFHLLREPNPEDEVATLIAEREAGSEATFLAERVWTICAWAHEAHGVSGVAEAMEAAARQDEPLPKSVEAAMRELADVEVGPSLRDQFSLTRAFEALEQEDHFEVFKARHLDFRVGEAGNAKRPTLDQLGKKLGVTRERVRQLEGQIRKRIGLEMKDGDSPIRVAAARMALRFGPLARADELAGIGAVLDPSGEALEGSPHRIALLLDLAGDYRLTDRWILSPEIAGRSAAVLKSITKEGPVSLARACEELGALGIREELQVPWLDDQEGFRVIGDMLAPWGRSMADKAVSVLAVAGEPLELEDLFERIGQDRNFRAFKQQVQGDSRVRRRGIKHYGLEAWGGEEYTTIVDEMTEELERQGGSMELEVLAATLARNFGVSEASVRMYAGGPQFHLDDSGGVRRRSGALPVPPTRPLELTRYCYRVNGGWAYRRTVDDDVLRGSGGSLPIGFAKEVGLAPGESLTLDSPHGQIAFSWPSHMAHIGSLRAVAKELDASIGDHLFVVRQGSDGIDVRIVRQEACSDATDWERLALECAADSGPQPMEKVAVALGLEPDQPNVGVAIRMRLRERGETELAECVPEVDVHGDDVLDVLESLGGSLGK